MKLKILFFPLMLIAAVSVFIGYIWPEIGVMRTLATENDKLAENLELIKEKKDIVRMLDQELGRNSDKEELVRNYLAMGKNEEKIIDVVNFLAAGSGVSLVNMSIEGGKENALESKEDVPVSEQFFNPFENTSLENDGALAQQDVPVSLGIVPARVIVSGSYGNIKGFLSGLGKASLMNSIKSVDISPQSSGGEEGESGADSDNLTAEISGEFYYMKKVRVQNSLGLKILDSPELNFSQVEKIKQSISQSVPKLEIGEKGAANPFLAR